MEELIIYFLKAAGIASIFYLLHFFLLKEETSFRLIRFFFLFGIIFSLTLPQLTISKVVFIDAPEAIIPATTAGGIVGADLTSSISLWQITFYLYLAGVVIFLSKMVFQLISLLRFLRKGNSFKEGTFNFIQTKEQVQPFSFFRTIIFNPDLHSAEELKMILKHEKAHGRQFHTIDVLIVNLFASVLWFFPLAWLYRKAVVQNLEYLADRSTVAAAVPVKDYQKVLVKVSVGDLQPALVNSFYQSLIKKRIIMLNKKSSQKTPFWKVSLVLPFLAIFTFLFNVETTAQVKVKKKDISIVVDNGDHFSVAITPTTTQQELENITSLAKEKGLELKFSNVKRNSKGLITNIEASFTKDSGQSGSYSLKDDEGINTFTFFINPDGKSGFRSTNTDTVSTFVRVKPGKTFAYTTSDSLQAGAVTVYADTMSFSSEGQNAMRFKINTDSTESDHKAVYVTQSKSVYYDKPLIVIDGKKMSASYNVNNIETENIETINVLKGENATKKYGDEAKGGVIEIKLKNKKK